MKENGESVNRKASLTQKGQILAKQESEQEAYNVKKNVSWNKKTFKVTSNN